MKAEMIKSSVVNRLILYEFEGITYGFIFILVKINIFFKNMLTFLSFIDKI